MSPPGTDWKLKIELFLRSSNSVARRRSSSPLAAARRRSSDIICAKICRIARDESERGADAMDRRAIRQIFAQIMSELLLRAAANGDDDLRRATLFDERKKSSIFNFQSVPGGDITILHAD